MTKRILSVLLLLILTLSMSSCVEAVLYSFEAEGDMSIVFTNDDEFYCYGDRGLFGAGSSAEPYLLTYPTLAVDVALSDTTAVFLAADGLYGSGVIADLPFDNPSTLTVDTPAKFVYSQSQLAYNDNAYLVSVDLSDAKQVVSGADFSLVLMKDGTVYGWGGNSHGQLIDDAVAHAYSPIRIGTLEGISQLAVGRDGICAAIDMDGHVWIWGYRVGNVPQKVDVEMAVEVVCTSSSVYILNADGRVYYPDSYAPTDTAVVESGQVLGLPDIFSLVATDSAVAVKDGDGNVWTWGDNSRGQLGRSEEGKMPIDTVEGLTNVISLSAGREHFMAMTQNMTVYAWGDNSHGQLGVDPASKPYSQKPLQAPKIKQSLSRA